MRPLYFRDIQLPTNTALMRWTIASRQLWYENGMKAAGSVMKAAGSVMKVRVYVSASYIDARVVANEALLLNVSRR